VDLYVAGTSRRGLRGKASDLDSARRRGPGCDAPIGSVP